MNLLRILQVGLGPLGRIIVSDIHARGIGRVVAAADPAPGVVDHSLHQIVPSLGASNVEIEPDVRHALAPLGGPGSVDCAIVSTTSDLRSCAPAIKDILASGISVVSTCEELVYPWLRHAAIADEIDKLAKKNNARVLGTGVNPGFLMDTLPVVATAVCRSVKKIALSRIQDATTRRVPFQKKIGAGLDERHFKIQVASGTLRHVGLGESLHFVSKYTGIAVTKWSESIEPVFAKRTLESGLGPIEAGRVAGVRQVATGHDVAGNAVLNLEFQAAIGQDDPHDRVVIDGEPPIDLVIRGGVHGDVATSSIVLNSIPRLLAAPPGLHTMATIPLVHLATVK